MRKVRPKKESRPPGRPRIVGPRMPVAETVPSPPSLPPGSAEPALMPLSKPPAIEKYWKSPASSKMRRTALRIVAMRAAGISDPEIAVALGLSPKSITPYVYRAGKNGWLNFFDPHHEMEYRLLHKVVRNLDQMLDSDQVLQKGDKSVRMEATLEAAKGTLFKRYDQTVAAPPPSTMVAIKIEMPQGPPQVMREETFGGVPNYIDVPPEK